MSPLQARVSLGLLFLPSGCVEVAQPSLGVGYELGRAVVCNKPVLCLFRPQSGRGEHPQPWMAAPASLPSSLRTPPSAPSLRGGGLSTVPTQKGTGKGGEGGVWEGATFTSLLLLSALSHDPGSSRRLAGPGVGLRGRRGSGVLDGYFAADPPEREAAPLTPQLDLTPAY